MIGPGFAIEVSLGSETTDIVDEIEICDEGSRAESSDQRIMRASRKVERGTDRVFGVFCFRDLVLLAVQLA